MDSTPSHFTQGGAPLSHDQHSLTNRYDYIYASAYAMSYSGSISTNGLTMYKNSYVSDSPTLMASPYQSYVNTAISSSLSSTIKHCAKTPSSSSSSSHGVMSSADLSRILLKVDTLSPTAASNLCNNNGSQMTPRLNAQPSFNPYGPTKAKLPRREDSNNSNGANLWNVDDSYTPGRPLNSNFAVNVLPTVNLASHPSDTDFRSKNQVTTPTRKSLPSLDMANGILNNGSFNTLLTNVNDSSTTVETTKSSFLATRHGSLLSLTSLLGTSSTPTTSTSSASLNKSADLVTKYGKMGRFLFGTDNKPLRLFFTKALYFSNHHPCDRLRIDGVNYSCTEQYYMYYKAYVFGDVECSRSIMQTSDPKAMKRLGASIRGFVEEQWNRISILVMVIASMHKYEQNPELRRCLFQTVHSQLVEANPTDQRWGIGLSMDSELAADPKRWRGQNWMGRLLTMLRDRLLQRPEFAAELRDLYTEHPYDPAGEHILIV